MKMRRFTVRRYLVVFLPAIFFILFFSLYLMMENVSVYNSESISPDEDSNSKMEKKMRQIEEELKLNQNTINRIKQLIREIGADAGKYDIDQIFGNIPSEDLGKSTNYSSGLVWDTNEVKVPLESCKLAQTKPTGVTIQMRDVYEKLKFDNPDGGVWKQGYPITYDPAQWKDQTLKVFIVPHSHTDPGWIKTFDGYYQDQTHHIFDLMVEKLEAYPTMRFIYAEMSFFSLWWRQIDEGMRHRVKKLLAEGRLELVTGGWVMTDEANAHYFAMIDQLIEGNQWILNQLGVKPVSGWAIDPFGYTATMAYLLRESGFKNMLIQRAHYSIKKYLSQQKQLEFLWRQTWDHSGTTDMFCHLMPFYSYDVPHTCGPDPKVCCQFDFKRLQGGNINCPWKIPPVVINSGNVADRAELLLDQYRKKAQLYKNNVVLIPLGDDFRYDKPEEWDRQHDNYKQLIDYINSEPTLNAEVHFGTLTDYFNALRERSGNDARSHPMGYPVLSGDFFSYADRDDHYWTGYFTSRPFYKRLDRVLESHLRGGEILYSLALAEARRHGIKTFPKDALLSRIVLARRSLGLFQHHDAVAGTAKDFVVIDYGMKLLDALNNMKRVMMDSAQLLLTPDKSKYNLPDVPMFDVDEIRASHDSLPEKTVIRLTKDPRPVVFYNSLAHNRTSLVTVYVDEPHVQVRSADGVVVPTQISPQWKGLSDISGNVYRVNFVVTLPALGLVKFSIAKTEPGQNKLNTIAKVIFYNSHEKTSSTIGPFTVEKLTSSDLPSKMIAIENKIMKLHFAPETGLLKAVLMKDSMQFVQTNVTFVRYGVRHGKDRSGAYLFLPDGEAQPVQPDQHPAVKSIEGPLISSVQVALPFVDHTVKITNFPGVESSSVEVLNMVDIRSSGNTEVAMRIMTDIKSGDEFFTDSNGFQVLRRKTYEKLPLNANFYPMSTVAFVEDNKHRFSLVSGQSLGVASLKTGWLEVMQDRRLDQDDQRGLNQPVHDNKVTPNLFRFVIEGSDSTSSVDQHSGFPSLFGHLISQDLLHPVHVLPSAASGDSSADGLLPVFQPLQLGLPCDVHLVNLRTLLKPEDGVTVEPADETALILHRLGVDCRFRTTAASCHLTNGQVPFSNLFRVLRISEGNSTTLSLINHLSRVNSSTTAEIPSMEIRAFTVRLH